MRSALIVHGAHHKAGTSWMESVLGAVADELGLRYYGGPQEHLPRDAEIFFESKTRIDVAGLPRFRGSHLVRDPRDMAVSAYHYHLWSHERWLQEPVRRLRGRSYQQHLLALDHEAGLHFEIERVAASLLQTLEHWDFDDPRILELRYEELLADERGWFTRLFHHYGLPAEQVRRSVVVALRWSFEHRAGRPLGAVREASHLRSGLPGQWRNELTREHLEHLYDLLGDLLLRMGYQEEWPGRPHGPTPASMR